jgi:hypothetical protein
MKTDDLSKIEIPDGLEAKLENLIDHFAEIENQSKKKVKQIRWWTSSAAASLLLLVSAGVFFLDFDRGSKSEATVQTSIETENQYVTCREVQRALALVSINFNKGMNQLAMATNEIEKSNKTLNKTLKR